MEWLVGNGGGGSVEYTGGHGIDVDNANHIISVDQYEIQDKLTAGNNITITNNVISAADQVQSDWTESDTSSKAYIAHKPTIPTATSDLTNDSNFITASDVPGSQVQSDWTESDTSNPAYIAHKPSIPTATSDLTNDSNFITASDVPSSQVQSDWTESDSSDPAYIANKPTLAAVATSGDYSDLSNTPSIPTATSDLQNDSGFITASDIPAQVQSDWTESDTTDPAYIANKPTLATVATSGSYNDLSNTPTIPSGNQLLPSATSSDEGKILTVDSNGDPSWAPSQGGGGSVNEVFDWSTVTTTNIANCLTNGHNPIIKYEYSADMTQYAYLESVEPMGSGTAYSFYSPVQGNSDNGLKTMTRFYLTDWGIKTVTRGIRVSTPSSSQSDAGKVLTVNSLGYEVWDNVPTELPASTSADEGKVLTVDSNGDAAWATGGSVTQVQSDWTETDTTDASFIQNKPTTKPIAAGSGISVVEYADNVTITNTAAQVQSDWAESTSTEPNYIKNKPTVKQIVAGANVTINESNSQITISSTGAGGVPVQADWTQADNSQPDYIKNKPTIPTAQVQSNWTEADTTSKSFILNKPVTKPIVAGNGIVITETATEIVISLA